MSIELDIVIKALSQIGTGKNAAAKDAASLAESITQAFDQKIKSGSGAKIEALLAKYGLTPEEIKKQGGNFTEALKALIAKIQTDLTKLSELFADKGFQKQFEGMFKGIKVTELSKVFTDLKQIVNSELASLSSAGVKTKWDAYFKLPVEAARRAANPLREAITAFYKQFGYVPEFAAKGLKGVDPLKDVIAKINAQIPKLQGVEKNAIEAGQKAAQAARAEGERINAEMDAQELRQTQTAEAGKTKAVIDGATKRKKAKKDEAVAPPAATAEPAATQKVEDGKTKAVETGATRRKKARKDEVATPPVATPEPAATERVETAKTKVVETETGKRKKARKAETEAPAGATPEPAATAKVETAKTKVVTDESGKRKKARKAETEVTKDAAEPAATKKIEEGKTKAVEGEAGKRKKARKSEITDAITDAQKYADAIKRTDAKLDKVAKDTATKRAQHAKSGVDKLLEIETVGAALMEKVIRDRDAELSKMDSDRQKRRVEYATAETKAYAEDARRNARAYAQAWTEAIKENKSRDKAANQYLKDESAAWASKARKEAAAYNQAWASALKENKALDNAKARYLRDESAAWRIKATKEARAYNTAWAEAIRDNKARDKAAQQYLKDESAAWKTKAKKEAQAYNAAWVEALRDNKARDKAALQYLKDESAAWKIKARKEATAYNTAWSEALKDNKARDRAALQYLKDESAAWKAKAKKEATAYNQAWTEALRDNKARDRATLQYLKDESAAWKAKAKKEASAYNAAWVEALKDNKARDRAALQYLKDESAAWRAKAKKEATAYNSAWAEALKTNKALDNAKLQYLKDESAAWVAKAKKEATAYNRAWAEALKTNKALDAAKLQYLKDESAAWAAKARKEATAYNRAWAAALKENKALDAAKLRYLRDESAAWAAKARKEATAYNRAWAEALKENKALDAAKLRYLKDESSAWAAKARKEATAYNRAWSEALKDNKALDALKARYLKDESAAWAAKAKKEATAYNQAWAAAIKENKALDAARMQYLKDESAAWAAKAKKEATAYNQAWTAALKEDRSRAAALLQYLKDESAAWAAKAKKEATAYNQAWTAALRENKSRDAAKLQYLKDESAAWAAKAKKEATAYNRAWAEALKEDKSRAAAKQQYLKDESAAWREKAKREAAAYNKAWADAIKQNRGVDAAASAKKNAAQAVAIERQAQAELTAAQRSGNAERIQIAQAGYQKVADFARTAAMEQVKAAQAAASGNVKEAERAAAAVIAANKGAANAMKNLSASLNTMHQSASQNLMTLSYQFNHIGMQMGIFSAAMLAAFKAPIAAAAELDKIIQYTASILMETTGGMLELRDAAMSLGSSTIYGPIQIAEGLKALAQAGFDASGSIANVKTILDFAAAGMTTLDEAVKISVATMTTFAMSAKDLVEITNQIAVAANKTNTDVEGMGNALKYVGPAAHQLGIPLKDVLATLGQFSQAGINATMAGTSFRNITLRLINPTGRASAEIKRLGINMKDANGDFIGLTDAVDSMGNKIAGQEGVITQFRAALDKIPDSVERAKVINTIFGIRGGPAFTALLQIGEEKVKALSDAIEKEGDNAKIAAERSQSLWGSIERLGNAFTVLKEAIGFAASDGLLTRFIGGLADVIGQVAKLVNMSPEIKFMVQAFMGFAAVAGVLAGFVASVALATSMLVSFGQALTVFEAGTLGAAASQVGVLTAKMFGMSTATFLAIKNLDLLSISSVRATVAVGGLGGALAVVAGYAMALFAIYEAAKIVYHGFMAWKEGTEQINNAKSAMDRFRAAAEKPILTKAEFSLLSEDQKRKEIQRMMEMKRFFIAEIQDLELQLAKKEMWKGLTLGMFGDFGAAEIKKKIDEVQKQYNDAVKTEKWATVKTRVEIDKEKAKQSAVEAIDYVAEIMGDKAKKIKAVDLSKMLKEVDDSIDQFKEMGTAIDLTAKSGDKMGRDLRTALDKVTPGIDTLIEGNTEFAKSFGQIPVMAQKAITRELQIQKTGNDARLGFIKDFFGTYQQGLEDQVIRAGKTEEEIEAQENALLAAREKIYEQTVDALDDMYTKALEEYNKYAVKVLKGEQDLAQKRVDMSNWVKDQFAADDSLKNGAMIAKERLENLKALELQYAEEINEGKFEAAQKTADKIEKLAEQAADAEKKAAASTLKNITKLEEEAEKKRKEIDDARLKRQETIGNKAEAQEEKLGKLRTSLDKMGSGDDKRLKGTEKVVAAEEKLRDIRATDVDNTSIDIKEKELATIEKELAAEKERAAAQNVFMEAARKANDERIASEKDVGAAVAASNQSAAETAEAVERSAARQIELAQIKLDKLKAEQQFYLGYLDEIATLTEGIKAIWTEITQEQVQGVQTTFEKLKAGVKDALGMDSDKPIDRKLRIQANPDGTTSWFVKQLDEKTGKMVEVDIRARMDAKQKELFDKYAAADKKTTQTVDVKVGEKPAGSIEKMVKQLGVVAQAGADLGPFNPVVKPDIQAPDKRVTAAQAEIAAKGFTQKMKLVLDANGQQIWAPFWTNVDSTVMGKAAGEAATKFVLKVEKTLDKDGKVVWRTFWTNATVAAPGAIADAEKAVQGLNKSIVADSGKAAKRIGQDFEKVMQAGSDLAKELAGDTSQSVSSMVGSIGELASTTSQAADAATAAAKQMAAAARKEASAADKAAEASKKHKDAVVAVAAELARQRPWIPQVDMSQMTTEFEKFLGNVQNWFSDVVEGYKITFQELWQSITKAFNAEIAIWKADIEKFWAEFKAIGSGIGDWFKSQWDTVWGYWSTTAKDAWTAWSTFITGLVDTVWGAIKSGASSMWGAVTGAAQAAFQELFSWLNAIFFGGLKKKIDEAISWFKKLIGVSNDVKTPSSGSSSGGDEEPPPARYGGLIGFAKGLAEGGALPGYGGGDRRLYRLEDGEFVMPKEATRAVGVDFLDWIRRSFTPGIPSFTASVPRMGMALGGVVGGGGGGSNSTTTLKFEVGGKTYPLTGTRSAVSELKEALRREGLTKR